MPGAVELGRVIGAFGIQGWVRIRPNASPPEGILRYRRWRIGDVEYKVNDGRAQSGTVVAKLQGIDDRDAAIALRGAVVAVDRAVLPKTKRREFYWADVLGARVVSTSGAQLGTLQGLTSNGAQDVMVVMGERERLIPFVSGPIVKSVDPVAKEIVVEWEPEF